jgi:multidrug efflux pump
MSDKKQKTERRFGLTTWAVDNRVTVMVITVLVIFAGISSYIALPKESFPEVKMPTIYVGTAYPGNSPSDMENLVTRKIEKEIKAISSVSKITSNSVQDFSNVIVEFNSDVKTEDALQKVKDAVDKAKKELPTDLPADPNVFELNFSEFPFMNVNLSGDFSNEQLKIYAEYLEDKMEALKEVSTVNIRGLDEKEVKIEADLHKMEAREITFRDIEGAIGNENLTMSGGNILIDGNRRTIRIVGEFDEPSQLEDIIIKNEKQNIVYLRDVANIYFDYKETTSFARLDGKPVVMLDVIKRSGENLIIASEKINKILADAQNSYLPKNLKITITNDQSDMTKDNVANLENNIISGVILVVLVLLFFIGTRNAMFVGVAIPMSMFMSFIIMSALGININMMTLFALIMALGMLVDNGIVVVENVYRLKEQGENIFSAAKKGVGEVAMPIISSTATTLAAFLPLAIWPGIMGEFMKFLPITLIIALGSSLFVALVINPALVSYFMIDKKETKKGAKFWAVIAIMIVFGIVSIFAKSFAIGNLLIIFALLILLNAFILSPLSDKFQNGVLPVLEKKYENSLRLALNNPYKIFFGTFGLLIFSIVLMGIFTPKVLFFPLGEPKYVNVFIEFPIGTDIETTNKYTQEVERQVFEIVKPYKEIVEAVIANVGEGTGDPGDPSSIGQSNTPYKARITVSFLKFNLRQGISTTDVMEKIREGIKKAPGVIVTVDKNNDGPPVGKPINIEISGDDYLKLAEIAEEIKFKINDANIAGIEELKADLESGKPELLITIDRDKARRFGLSTGQIATTIRTALFGKEVSKYKEGEDDYKINIRLADKYRYDLDAMMNQQIIFRDQTNGKISKVPVSSVAKAEFASSYGAIRRKNLDRVVTISSNVLDGFNPTEVNDKIRDLMDSYSIPAGYEVKFTGEQEKQAEEMAFLSSALMIAVFLIFLIIVGQFNMLSAPLIIMTSVFFSTIGVFLGLVIFQMDFIIIMTMIGIISLAGIVVNNAIVLIDFIVLIKARFLEIREEGYEISKAELKEIIVEAGKTRLRPVLLTAITTVFGLIPLAVGLNIDFIKLITEYNPDFYIGGDNVMFWGPMSWTIVYGLLFATFLTLILVPVLYLLNNGAERRIKKLFS